MLTGFEISIVKTATSGAVRATSPVRNILVRSLSRRRIKQALTSGSSITETDAFLSSLNPDIAQELVRFVSSADLKNLSMNLATDIVLGRFGKSTNKVSKELKAQLRALLILKTHINESDVDAATETIFATLSKTVSTITLDLLEEGDALSPSAKASILKVQDSYIDSTIRNSALLAEIQDLSSYKSFEDQFRLQVRNLYGTMRLPHAGTTRRVPYEKLYVQPHVRFLREENATIAERGLTVEDLANHTLRIVLLGDPGGGKSTLSLKMTFDRASETSDNGEASVPFLVILREYANEMSKRALSLVDYLEQTCKVLFSVQPPSNALEYILLNGRGFVIFDGLDELVDTALRRQVVDAVTAFAHRYPTTSILVTSRRIGYSDAPLDPDLFAAFSLCEFDSDQVAKYVSNWFELDESVQPVRREELRRSFLADSEFVQDLRVNPLMLSLMCGIYASENYIPRNRPDVYEKCALLLFESWDKQRGIKVPLSFDAHVQAAMRSLALWLYPQQASQQGLPRAKLINYMKEYLFKKRFDNEEEAENAATEFIDFCKGRAWVLTDVGAELYGFTHRTFLEYFAASQIVRENRDPAKLFDYLVERLRGGGWEVVAQLALQILNKWVEDGADDFLELLLAYANSETEPALKDKLLSFATQALAYIVPRPPVLQKLVIQAVEYYCEHAQKKAGDGAADFMVPIHLLLEASSENLSLVSKYLYDHLVRRLKEDPSNSSPLSIALYTDVFASAIALRSYGAGRNTTFWHNEIQVNVSRFQTAIAAQRDTNKSVAIYLLEHGQASADETIDRFGPAIIFEPIPYPEVPGQELSLAARILLGVGHTQSARGIAYSETEMTPTQVEELKEALLNVPVPWSVPSQLSALLGGLVNFILDYLETGAHSGISSSMVLLLLAATYDMTSKTARDRYFAATTRRAWRDAERKLRPGTEFSVILQILGARTILLGSGHDATAEALSAGQESLFQLRGNENGIRTMLATVGVDERTAALIQAWSTDRRFRIIKTRSRNKSSAH